MSFLLRQHAPIPVLCQQPHLISLDFRMLSRVESRRYFAGPQIYLGGSAFKSFHRGVGLLILSRGIAKQILSASMQVQSF